jgi:hypothetical protein
MVAAVQLLDDAAESRVDAFDVVAIELAPDAVLQVLQLAARFIHERLGLAAGGVVGPASLVVRLAGVIEFLVMCCVVFCLLLDACGFALQLVQQVRVTSEAVLLATAAALCIGHSGPP